MGAAGHGRQSRSFSLESLSFVADRTPVDEALRTLFHGRSITGPPLNRGVAMSFPSTSFERSHHESVSSRLPDSPGDRCHRCDPDPAPEEPDRDPAVAAAERRGVAWIAGSFLLCPCHLPLTLAAVSALLGGTALGVALRENLILAGVVIAIGWLVGTGRGLYLLRRAREERRA